ncbi:unnamed protein product [Paramecium sonneborni]|uniref:Uncharacterized protein n=1 Tax=Paramecium sonneborni TaxID=65129 RepID=A0A8S1M9U0_9CILI|nr:unnamed protein product [Paramecium sonneborni]
MIHLSIGFQKVISQGEYENDHISRLERVNDDQLIYSFNDNHHEHFIQFSVISNKIPVILQKLMEDFRGVDLILLGYLQLPIDDSDQDALLQKVSDETQGRNQECKKLEIHENIILQVYKDDHDLLFKKTIDQKS